MVDAPVVRDCKSGDVRERQNSTVGDSSRAAHLIAKWVLFVSYVSASTLVCLHSLPSGRRWA